MKTISLVLVLAVSTIVMLSIPNDALAVTFNQFNDASKFVDISGFGNEIFLSDDGEVTIATTVGRPGFFDSGNVCIGANGAIGEGACGNLGFSNGAIPSSSVFNFATSLLPFWDDIDPGNGGQMFWDEVVVDGKNTLIVQWHDVPIFAQSVGDIRFQLQLYECGDIAARYTYPDVFLSTGNSHNNGGSATIGYQVDSITAFQFSLNQPVINNFDVLDLEDFDPCGLVGGEILPINTTALLLAGVQTNLAWMIPIAFSAVGIGVILVKTKKFSL